LKKLANSIKSNPGYKMLDHALLEKMFKDAEDFIAANEKERLETKQRKEAEDRKNAADKSDRCKKILDDILNEMEPAKAMKDPLAGVSSLKELRESFCKTAGSQNLKVVELTDRYIAVLSLLTKEPDVTLIRHFRDLRYLARPCRRCKDGIQICKECRGSKICQRCEGRGGYQTRHFEFGGSGDGLREGSRWVQCNKTCTACEVPEKCRFCRGKGILISIKQCSSQLSLIFKNMQIQVKQFK
jgi:hypothetical protein